MSLLLAVWWMHEHHFCAKSACVIVVAFDVLSSTGCFKAEGGGWSLLHSESLEYWVLIVSFDDWWFDHSRKFVLNSRHPEPRRMWKGDPEGGLRDTILVIWTQEIGGMNSKKLFDWCLMSVSWWCLAIDDWWQLMIDYWLMIHDSCFMIHCCLINL